MRLLRLVSLIAFIFLSLLVIFGQEQQESNFDLDRIKRATVFVMQTQTINNQFVVTCVGSGTIVRFDGLILTNAHHIVQSETCPGNSLIVALTTDPEKPPIPRYRAEIAQVDIGLDLALLQIREELDGRLIDLDALPPLPFVELAPSDNLVLDNTVTVVGYPGIGNDPVSESLGTVTGFISEARGGDNAWIKTSAVIPGTMTGGGAYNRDGLLVGIPTTAPTDIDNTNTSCQLIEDTNQDGFINNNDRCVPIGNFTNVLRPTDFARVLIRSASLGLQVDTITSGQFQIVTIDEPSFSRLFFSPSVVNGYPSTVVGSLPAGTNSLYLFFDYDNMTSETVYELQVTIDGIPDQTFSLSPVRWSGGQNGLWYIGSRGQPWRNGVYEFRLFIDGVAAGSQSIVVGGAAEESPSFSNVAFGIQDLQGNVLGNGYVLPTGSIASARFIYQNMIDGAPWTAIWYFNGNPIPGARTDDIWRDGLNGSKTISLQPQDGLVPGRYRVELYIENRLSSTADFVIAGAQEGAFPRIFTETHFSTGDTPAEAVNAPRASSFSSGAQQIYALFNWELISPGTLWTMRWSVDDEVFFEQTVPWVTASSGQDFISRLTADGDIPDGTYQFDLFLGGVQLASETAQVGIGQLPIDRFADASGVELRGQIIDASTREAIEGVTFVLISEDYSVDDFVWDIEQTYAVAVTDRNGDFRIDRPLQIDAPYSIYITADGYLPITADGFTIEEDDGNTIEMLIPLTRD